MKHPLLAPEGECHLLLGNEAIVRGALEAGINMVTCYPGTPSSEVPDTFARIRDSNLFTMEYSVNEKVALEVGAGAAMGGALTLVTMKHVGVNVAADPLMTMTYIGLPGGLVLLSADDPGCHSSQNEQDNRTYARFGSMPCFEPSTAQEAKDMTKAALLLARETSQPVLLRTTTRVNHLRGPVTYGPLPNQTTIVPFKRDPLRFVPTPVGAQVRHKILLENMEKITAQVERSPFNKESGSGAIGIIASGISRSYLHDVLHSNNWQDQVRVLDFGMTYPFPSMLMENFMRKVSQVVVLEEGEPFVENELRVIAHKKNINITIHGKGPILTRLGEYSTPLIQRALAPLLGAPQTPIKTALADLPNRPPNLCAGCAHRSVFYAVRQIFGDNAYYSSDIGCYTLGLLPPLAMADFLICMGSSISAGSGFAKSSGKPVVAFIGDSTFFHSGMTGLVNAVFNKHDVLVIVLDNGTTAMTGHQPNPGVLPEVLGDTKTHIDIESIVRGIGVTEVHKLKGYNQKNLQKTLLDLKEKSGVRVLIVDEPCVLFARRVLKKPRTQVAYVAEQNASALSCLANYACPAFKKEQDIVSVDPELCAGCMVCIQISPSFKAKKRGA